MAWRIEGTYFENCNCTMVCPCSTSGLSAPADYDRCQVLLEKTWRRGKAFSLVLGVALIGYACFVPWNPSLVPGLHVPTTTPM